MRTVLAILLVSALASGRGGPDHPEWGPPPPVAPYSMQNLPAEHVVIPLVFPVLGESRWTDDYNESRGTFRHTGIDIKATKMTPIVAPFSGRLGFKRETFWIYGDDGWSTLGTHLNDDNPGKHDHAGDRDVMFAPNIVPYQHVVAGQFLGYVGESGDATAPHLHFEIYAPGAGPTMGRIRDAFLSLKAAKILKAPVPAPTRINDAPPAGEIRIDGCIRRSNMHDGTLTLLLADEQSPAGIVQVVTRIAYKTVSLSAAALNSVGGWRALRSLEPTDTVAVFAPESKGVLALANRLLIEKNKP